MMRTLRRPPPTARTLRDDLRDDVRRVMERLRNDRDLIEIYWNQLRDRSTLIDALRTSWASLTIAQLVELEPTELAALDAFHEVVDQLRVWASNTEVMPATLGRRLDAAIDALEPLAAAALARIGA